MNKKEFVRRVAKKYKLPIVHVEPWVDVVLDELSNAIIDEDRIYLRGLGTFKQVDRREKTLFNPATGEPMLVPAHKSIKFIPTVKLTNGVNGVVDNGADDVIEDDDDGETEA